MTSRAAQQAPAVATPRVMALVTGALYVVGGCAAVVASATALGGLSGPLLATGLGAVTGGALILQWGPGLPRGAFHALAGSGTVLIVVGTLVAPDLATAVAIGAMISFVAVYAFFFFAWWGATAHLVGAMVSCSVALDAVLGLPASSWVVVDATCVGIAAVVGALVRRASSAGQDPVTGLANRRGFDEALEERLRHADRTGEPLSGVLLDLDHFKVVNDTRGHDAGDVLLRDLADHCRALTPVDAVLARHGGDEFALLLPDHDGADALAVVERIRATAPTGLSCGVTAHRRFEGAAQLMRRADRALYQAKAAGRGRSVLDERETPDDLVRDLVAAVEAAEETPEATSLDLPVGGPGLFVAYQHVVSLDDGAVVGVEALARWRHPTLGVVPPVRFIPLAEQSGVVDRLGEVVMRRAFADLALVRARTGRRLLLTVNVSGHQLCDPGFPDAVQRALDAHGWDPASTVLEVTESLLEAESSAALGALATLRSRGLSVAIDDFGTGYSSLSRLDTLPSDYLKLDSSFVATVTTSAKRAQLVQSILLLSRAMDLVVIAEGVETAADASTLRGLGCRLAQGYHFQRPGPLREVLADLDPAPRGPVAADVAG